MHCLHCFLQYVCIFSLFFCFCFKFVSLLSVCVRCCKETNQLFVARPGSSTAYVTLCLRYSMYWFPRYNVSFRQHMPVRQSHGQRRGPEHIAAPEQSQAHLSNSDEEGGIARRRVPRRTSSEIASAKIAGRPIPVKVILQTTRKNQLLFVQAKK